jgi:hydrogenase/urease accessory protein HupE
MIAGAAGLTAAAALARGHAPAPRIFVGAVVAGTVLAIASQAAPQAAQRFAGVVFLTALLTSGYDVAKGVNAALSR